MGLDGLGASLEDGVGHEGRVDSHARVDGEAGVSLDDRVRHELGVSDEGSVDLSL